MDAVPSGEDEEDPVKAIGIEPDYRRTDEDGHHCKQPHRSRAAYAVGGELGKA